MHRRRLVRVPASSANLGPGFDVLAAALGLHVEVEVEETGGDLVVECDTDGVPCDRTNLCVQAFERLHPADGPRRVVCVLTGHGLKDPQTALGQAGSVVPCEPDIGAVERAVLG